MIHGSKATNERSYSIIGRKSWLGGRPAGWTPAKAKPKNRLMSGAGDSRRDQMSLRQQLRRRLRRRESRSRSHREVPCSRRFLKLVLLQGVVLLRQEQPEACFALGVEAFKTNEASDDELEAEYQEAAVPMTTVKQRKLPGARCRQLGHWKDDHSCLVKVKRVNWADGASGPKEKGW